MLQTIGLIVAAYSLVRLWQIPWESSIVAGIDLKIPDGARWMIVAGASLGGIMLIGLLALSLLFTTSPR